jgi:hypothetical protein
VETISLHQLIGQEIIAHVPMFHQTKWQTLKLINVETAGIWVESRDFQEWAIQNTGISITPKTAVLFLPFHQIVHILGSLDVPYVSDKALT